MKLIIEEYKNAKAVMAGLFQFNPNEKFTQTILTVTDNEFLFYNDNKPDTKEGENYKYNVKKRLNLDDYPLVIDEQIIKNKDLANMKRLTFYSEDEDKCFEFYYFLNDVKEAQEFIKRLKKFGIEIRNRKVDLSLRKY